MISDELFKKPMPAEIPAKEIVEAFGVEYISHPIPHDASKQALRVVDIIGEALSLFLEKNRGYGATADHLGARGQYADMHRKMGKLRHTLWDGNPAVGEGIEEMCMDLIGHCALTIDYLRQEKESDR